MDQMSLEPPGKSGRGDWRRGGLSRKGPRSRPNTASTELEVLQSGGQKEGPGLPFLEHDLVVMVELRGTEAAIREGSIGC